MTLGVEWVLAWARGCAETASAHRNELIELDRAIGDADHGENMDRGFRAVAQQLPLSDNDTVGEVLRTIAITLMSQVGGAAGPLYGTAFLRGSKAVGNGEIDGARIVAFLEAALTGVQARGRAEVGEKTMVDAWAGALEAARAAVARGDSTPAVWRAAATGAQQGAEATVPMLARKGRASYLGERSIGHLDPGARSTALILAAAASAAGA